MNSSTVLLCQNCTGSSQGVIQQAQAGANAGTCLYCFCCCYMGSGHA